MKHLVIGLGEVGKALQEILQCEGFDAKGTTRLPDGPFDMLHICFPYHEMSSFAKAVGDYRKQVNAARVVIHSTVPVGTSRLCEATHSPIRGMHPNLAASLRTFPKYVGGPDAGIVAAELETFGIRTSVCPSAEDTEALKLWDTTYYLWNIHYMRSVKKFCDTHHLDFTLVYEDANRTYNEGYEKMGKPDVRRPVLAYAPGKTGGHCLVQNARLLHDALTHFLLEEEKKL